MAIIETRDLAWLLESTSKIEGDVMEIGVFVAETFHRLVPLANLAGKKAFALDSFQGMDEPGEYDGDGYPKGRLTSHGVNNFNNIMTHHYKVTQKYETFEGYIPTCFENFDKAYPNHKLSFALLDVDHYMPTLKSLEWVWPKISKNGIMVLDNYFRGGHLLASKAIEEWIPQQHFMDYKIHELKNSQLFIEKL